MKLPHRPESARRALRASEFIQPELSTEDSTFTPELDIRKEDKEYITTEVSKNRPSPTHPKVDAWLMDFAYCVELFPDARFMEYSPEEWGKVLDTVQARWPGMAQAGEWGRQLSAIHFVRKFFPERQGEFTFSPGLERILKKAIQDIKDHNPIDTDALLTILQHVRGILPGIAEDLTAYLSPMVTHFPSHLKTQGRIDAFTDRLVNIRLLFPEAYAQFSLSPDDWKMMKAHLRPLEPRDDYDWYLNHAHALLVLSAQSAALSKDGTLMMTPGHQGKLKAEPRLPDRLVA